MIGGLIGVGAMLTVAYASWRLTFYMEKKSSLMTVDDGVDRAILTLLIFVTIIVGILLLVMAFTIGSGLMESLNDTPQ